MYKVKTGNIMIMILLILFVVFLVAWFTQKTVVKNTDGTTSLIKSYPLGLGAKKAIAPAKDKETAKA